MQESKVKKILEELPKSVVWKNGGLYLLDQTRLPLEVVIEKQENIKQVWNSIKMLKVRGAPAIGIAAAYGLLIEMKNHLNQSAKSFFEELEKNANYLNASRPTAVNLAWALKRMVTKAESLLDQDTTAIYKVLIDEAIQIHEEDRALCWNIGRNGLQLIKEDMGILTHCNAGSLAVSELGTALAPIYYAHANGINFQVYADETRPLLQGARLTSWELQQAGIDVTLICDDMAAHLMSSGLINLVIVGTDRVAANGDVANKIGTLGLAILANYFSIPFYVACPSSTIDLQTQDGKLIIIEERQAEEVTHFGLKRTAPEGIKVRNPAFDVTPHELVTGIITEKGILKPPYSESLIYVNSSDISL